MTQQPEFRHTKRLREAADELLPDAFGSLRAAALHAVATLHPDMAEAVERATEQTALVERILNARITPFHPDDPEHTVRAWLDASIDKLDTSNPLLARYSELHEMRLRWLPARN